MIHWHRWKTKAMKKKQINALVLSQYMDQIRKILKAASAQISSISPSDWCEKNRVMTSDVSSLPGPFSYDNSPYTREIIDRLRAEDPSIIIAVMKGAQLGLSVGLMEAGIGWIISQNPANILFMVGHADLVKESMKKIDVMIQNSGLRHLIKSSVTRNRNSKSGDTDSQKEFPGGSLSLRVANHKALRNFSVKYGFIDDYDAMKSNSKEAGSTKELVEQRFASFGKAKKIFFISSPELKENSNIYEVYLQGDQRKYHVQCPCCSDFITLEWEVKIEHEEFTHAGMVWDLDGNDNLIPGSVRYRCQNCFGEFDDSNKRELLLGGKWIPTAEPKKPQHYSYQISALYAPTYMDGWEVYAGRYLEACPPNGKIKMDKWQSFKNVVLGEPFEPVVETVSAERLQSNIRPYEIGTVPEKLSLKDGNGRIVMITCAADMNGKKDDARLDYEIVAYAASGATYSILHGSIGKFKRIHKDPNRDTREKWSYQHGVANSVWPEFQRVIEGGFKTDTDNREMLIFQTGLDCGFLPEYAYDFIDSVPRVVGLKGIDDEKYVKEVPFIRSYKKSARNKLYLVQSNYTKDELAIDMQLPWVEGQTSKQPSGYMNFPEPSDGLYLYDNFFSHFDSEHKTVDPKTGKFRWMKKNDHVENHLYDCRLYNYVARDIFLTEKVFDKYGIKNGVWMDFVKLIYPDGDYNE